MATAKEVALAILHALSRDGIELDGRDVDVMGSEIDDEDGTIGIEIINGHGEFFITVQNA